MAASAQRLRLKAALATYPHTRALKEGAAGDVGLDFDLVEVSPIIAAFRRMIRTMEFDVSEMALSTYLCARAHGKPITAIPIFPLRSFQHESIVYNTKSGITGPGDLAGRRVGVRAYTVTGGVWVRGILHDEYGVDSDRVTWVVADEEHVSEYPFPPNVEQHIGQDLAKMLVDGQIDAAIGVGRVDSPDVRPLIPDGKNAAIAWAKKTGIYPINHTVVIKNELLDANRGLAEMLFGAFKRSKQVYLDRLAAGAATPEDQAIAGLEQVIGRDPIAYGIAANRPTIEAMIRYDAEQHVIPASVSVESLFAPSTLGLA